ncbi:alpha-(1,3)-fucosyltransferase C-like isoform X2 [Pecten maximus]|uniref:alpha-(1,3)-fucosyltransferase C-like isoform X2 n=1 Tax=Pecten maximus TaxID=6579 RepID=UPI001457F56C|nr:alpha-(1,3)-fucosyltransferase C-like isoform X2 [Pecten maximus]
MLKTSTENNQRYGAANFFYVTLFGVVLMTGLIFISPNLGPAVPIKVAYHRIKVSLQRPIQVHYYNRPPWVKMDIFSECDNNCYLTADDWNLNADSEVVIFHTPYVKEVHPRKKQGQIWVFHSLEPPWLHWCKLKNWTREFNWTMSYRRDSDILYTYADFQTQEMSESTWETETRKLGKTLRKKSTDIAWMVSHCGTPGKRDDYVNILKKMIPVDVYGKCGDKNCDRWKGAACLELYKFYLSFENQLCEDYITEKSFSLYYPSFSSIPITRGGSNYSMFLPPGSYIDSSEFQHISHLKNYIDSVSKNITKMMEYMRWRKHYQLIEDHAKPFCELCRRLHLKDTEKYRRVYRDIGEWQRRDKTERKICKDPHDLS